MGYAVVLVLLSVALLVAMGMLLRDRRQHAAERARLHGLMELAVRQTTPEPAAHVPAPRAHPRRRERSYRDVNYLRPLVVVGGMAAGVLGFVRSHLGATGVAAAVSVGLMLTPSLAPHVTEVPEPPSIALPSPTRPPLEVPPEPPAEPEPDTPEETAPDAGQSDPTTEAADVPDVPAPTPTASAGDTDNGPDTTPGSSPPEEEPRGQPPGEPEPPPGRSCSIIELDVDVATACLLPE